MKYTARQLQTLADVLLVVVIIIAVILGIFYLAILPSPASFILFIFLLIIGLLTAFTYKLVIKGFGELVENQAEQTELLTRMTVYLREMQQPKQNDDSAGIAVNVQPAGPVNPQSNASAPSATFRSRSVDPIVCPVCHKSQQADRNTCYSCGCEFHFGDEQQQQA